MHHEEIRRRSRWIIRAMEWDDGRARYPNLWHEGMPRNLFAFERIASRMRLGDLVATFYPPSQEHPDRAGKYVGLSRVVGLRRADRPGFAWIDLDTLHRFEPPLALEPLPRRVVLCCDAGWPEAEVALFRQLFEAAARAGWQPEEEDREPVLVEPQAPEPLEVAEVESVAPEAGAADSSPLAGTQSPPVEAPVDPAAPIPHAESAGRMFAGVDYSGDMRDPRDRTWLAILEQAGDALRLVRLEPTGRHGLQRFLRDPDRLLMHVEAIGLDFPFGLPGPFAEMLLGGPFPEEGWWALAKRFEKLSRPDYLSAVQDFRDAHGEPKRLTDEIARAFSPLHRVNPDLGPMTYHGIRMMAEDRSRYAIRPFESAQGKLLLEVYPGGLVKQLGLPAGPAGSRTRLILEALERLSYLPLRIAAKQQRICTQSRHALDAVIAARLAASAMISGEVDRAPDDLAPGQGERVRKEGWIYGFAESAIPTGHSGR